MVDSQYYLPNDIGISALDCGEAFRLLSPREKKYAHFLSRAAWYGGLVVLVQTSPESPNIFVLLQKIFRQQTPAELEHVATAAGLSPEEYQAFLVYAAGLYANMGNYKSFGDTKFIPNLPRDKLKALVWASQAFKEQPNEMEVLWDKCSCLLYSLEDRQKQLGLGSKGITTYFSGNCGLGDAELAQRFLDSKNLSAYNTRLFKKESGGKACYEVRLASAVQKECAMKGEGESRCGNFTFEECEFTVKRGDYAHLMEKVSHYIKQAQACAANDNQRRMLEEYERSFTLGSVDAHKEGSRYWIKDKGPIVESYIGFIESYRDPFGSRGEFEGFVAVVNKAMSERFARLVSSAEVLLPELPWPQEYEKDNFLKPDFTSLDVLTFAGSGIPAGINIPNYDDIRQSEGFKNVSLGNVLAVAYATQKDKLTFLEEEDKDTYIKWKGPSFEVQVGLHELLGHGSGKLFVQDDKGKFNFNKEKVTNPETGELVGSWYRGNETWDSKFSTIASSYEECRAECVGLYLCLNKAVLSIFGHEGKDAEEIVYVNWLNMVRAGLLGLEFYTPESKSWRQAHMQARFVILRVLLEAGEGLVKLEEVSGPDGRPDARITLDRSKIHSVGKGAIQRFLCKLQVLKSTADVEGGRKLYENYSSVGDGGTHKFLRLRDTVLLRKEARKMFVQANTLINGENVELVEYEGSAAGLIRSFVERFQDDAAGLEAHLLEMAKKDAPCCHYIKQAQACAANDNQRRMLEEYERSFTLGSVDAHKEGSRYWIKDKGPIVESYIGFIESYRDPFGSRGEFEGFVAVVNKAMSERFARLVSSAEVLLPELPWPQEYEKDNFLKPDFTSLDVLTFAGSGIPAGINIPNYDDIRQSEGFKNVSLGNVLAVAYATQKDKLTFLEEEDKDTYIKWKGPSFEVQVGLHELLGHGSGKLFVQDDKGKFNFNKEKVTNPETGELVGSWYRGNETWDSKFSTIASSYEECRAECVGLYLCLNKAVLSIFGHEGEDAEEIVYVNWLNMVRAGLLGLEFYTPESKSWRQAHMQARFVILRVLLEAGEGLVKLEEVSGPDGRPDARITLDRSKIHSVGKGVIQRFLCKLQVLKSTADVEGGRKLYENYSSVGDGGTHKFLRLRDTVLLRKEARKMFVQANTLINGENVELVEYEGSAAGLIRSFVERFQDDAAGLEAHLLEMAKKDAPCWC